MTIVVVPSFTAPPDFPALSDKPAGTYNSKAYAWAQAMPTSGNSIKDIGVATRTNALDAASSATAASTSASNAGSARDAAQTARDAAQAAQAVAEASAASALASPGTSATSATSLTVGTGSKTLAIQPGKALVIGQFVTIASAGTPANYMAGQITAHNDLTGSLTVNVTTTGGSGTAASWVVALTAPVGQVLAGTLTGALEYAAPASLASASTVSIGGAASNLVTVTGTTTITSLGTAAAGVVRKVTFAGALTLTHNATSLILPGAANITTASGDVAEFVALGGSNWRCTNYTSAAGLTLKTVNGTSLLGSGDIAIVGAIGYSARASNTQLVAADRGKLIDITSGTFAQTFAAASALGAGWYCYVRNSGTGDVTLDPNASEQIDGITSFIMYPGSARIVVCDGSAFRSIPISGGTKTFLATANYVWAPGIQAWDADLMGGGASGGGGARAATAYHGGAGGAGERQLQRIMKSQVTVGGSASCTVGAGGTGGNGATADNQSGAPGADGGTTSIGSLASASNGYAGGGATTAAHGGGGSGGGQGTVAAATIGTGQARATSTNTTEWAGTNGTPGNGGAPGLAVLGRQRGGTGGGSGGAAAGTNGISRTSSDPGWGGGGGGGNVNGSPAGNGGDGGPGYITIVEVI